MRAFRSTPILPVIESRLFIAALVRRGIQACIPQSRYIRQYSDRRCQAEREATTCRDSTNVHYLVTGGILSMNPAASVRGPKYVVRRGKTTVLSAEQARQLLDSIDPSKLMGLRDRALIGLMLFSFARVGAANTLRVGDYFENEKRKWLRLHEKGGKRHEVPCHSDLVNYLNAWIAAAGIGDDKKSWLFRSIRKSDGLTKNRMDTNDVLRMIKRRAKHADLPYSTCCHTFRATGITTYLKSGGTLEHAQQIAAHESPRTTKLYDRTRDQISVDEVERIKI